MRHGSRGVTLASVALLAFFFALSPPAGVITRTASTASEEIGQAPVRAQTGGMQVMPEEGNMLIFIMLFAALVVIGLVVAAVFYGGSRRSGVGKAPAPVIKGHVHSKP